MRVLQSFRELVEIDRAAVDSAEGYWCCWSGFITHRGAGNVSFLNAVESERVFVENDNAFVGKSQK